VVIERMIVDADYYKADGGGEEKIERVYRAHVLLNETHKEFGKTWAIRKEDAATGKVIDYSFDVKSIRNPIEEMLSQNGWKLSLVTLRKDASYKKKGWFR